MKEEIMELLRDINPYIELDEETMLLEEEVLDSTGILVLISELEHKYSVEILLDSIQIEDFETISGIVALIERLS